MFVYVSRDLDWSAIYKCTTHVTPLVCIPGITVERGPNAAGPDSQVLLRLLVVWEEPKIHI